MRTSYLDSETPFPLVIEPEADNVNLIAWAEKNRQYVQDEVTQHAAVLFRNFDLSSVGAFEEFVSTACGGALEYKERSSPRSRVSGNVYTSTDHPAEERIFLHNEQSYNLVFPLKILFFCVLPAQRGGNTPIADCRQLARHIDREILERFADQGYMYVRNFGDGFGLTWQTAFQTEDRGEVEEYCRRNDIRFEWKGDGRLRTRQVRRAVAKHPRTGESIWFNHLTFFHVSTLEPQTRAALLKEFSEEDLPNNTYYSDGSSIEPEVMDSLHRAYEKATVTFPWQRGDLLMLDNMLAAHARQPFEGPRKVVAAMAEPVSWSDV